MVFTSSQIENMRTEELVEELVNLSDMSTKLTNLTNKFDEFIRKYDNLHSELQLARNCNPHLIQRIMQLERNVVANSWYYRRKTIE